ncbi:MAG: dihydrolipoyl dehydrogenase [Planctomycetota bacterium]|nr:MAG: dihydrolipoyl dehydrogenase [Planctomycetota bacterium]
MPEIKTDAAVLGAGPAGYVAAIRLAQYGKKVVVVEEDNLGGTCLNVGCIPSKAMISAGHFLEQVRGAGEMGFTVAEPKLDLAKLVAWKESVVQRLTGGIGMLFKKRGIQVVKGRGVVTSPNTIEVQTADGVTRVSARDLVLASGSEPATLPGFEFGEHVWSSTEALAPEVLPKSLLVVGGGYIGMELGIFYAHMGTQVTVVEALDSILPGTDPELTKVVARKAKKAGIKIQTKTFAKEWKKKGKGVEVVLEHGGETKTLTCDRILMTVGRRPRFEGIGLENIGLKTVKPGFLEVNAQRQTKVPHVYAIGDLAGNPMLAHKGSAEGLAAAAAIAAKPGAAYDVKVVPAVIFTDPEIAYVGLTEKEAKEQGFKVKVGKFNFGANGRALSLRAAEGFIKVVADAEDDVILGVQMVGPEVTELIAEATLAIEAGLTAEDVALTVHAHPTLPETFMEACEDVHGLAVHAAK